MRITYWIVLVGNGHEVRRLRVDYSAADNTETAVRARITAMLSPDWTVDACFSVYASPQTVAFLDALLAAGLGC
ncbi:hypothetical protein [Nocardia wallacei]|uniref:hypothetical protein n=1 Tax=Nocardia wallacei TaxID=480035 RepID=UPI001656B01E|nr:hypothetical protein [Nocardia wallacei]